MEQLISVYTTLDSDFSLERASEHRISIIGARKQEAALDTTVTSGPMDAKSVDSFDVSSSYKTSRSESEELLQSNSSRKQSSTR